MKINKALDIKKALLTLSEELNISWHDLIARICFFDKAPHDILVDASNTWNEFDNADIVERGRMLGITVTVTK
jgi:hypothetical protein